MCIRIISFGYTHIALDICIISKIALYYMSSQNFAIFMSSVYDVILK